MASPLSTPLASTTLTVAYAAAGTYTLRIERIQLGKAVATATATVRINLAPKRAAGPGCRYLRLCPARSLRLSVRVQPAGSVYSWQDGSTGPTLLATTPSQYWVDVPK